MRSRAVERFFNPAEKSEIRKRYREFDFFRFHNNPSIFPPRVAASRNETSRRSGNNR